MTADTLVYDVLCPHPGHTLGPAFRWEGWSSAEHLYVQGLPVILCAPYLDERMLKAIDLTRVLGFVVDHGSVLDPLWDALAGVGKPSAIGALGLAEACRPRDVVVIDGANNQVVLRPEERALKRARRLKGTTPPREPAETRDILARLLEPIRHAWSVAGRTRPWDLPEQRQLYDVAWRCAAGGAPTPADDELVRRLLFDEPGKEGDPGLWLPGDAPPG